MSSPTPSDLPASPTPGSSLRDQMARSIRDAVRLRYGPGSREIACMGRVPSVSSECGACRARAILEAVLDQQEEPT